ncbi:13097_t:CDS:1, partial [Gigaspora rosea]
KSSTNAVLGFCVDHMTDTRPHERHQTKDIIKERRKPEKGLPYQLRPGFICDFI